MFTQNIPAGFTFIKEVGYMCGEIQNVVREYCHDKTGMEFVYIPGGTFVMGSPASEKGRFDDEIQHKVTLSPFLICKYPVIQEVWQKIMGNNPSAFTGKSDSAKRPVEQISWDDCLKFCKKTELQLPTEAQWEFACRAGSTRAYCFGDDESKLNEYAWYTVNSGGETHAVGQKKPNAFGLYDVHGNVWEWCEDWDEEYEEKDMVDPKGPNTGLDRVCRGGGWFNSQPRYCRSACRDNGAPSFRASDLGMRCALSLNR